MKFTNRKIRIIIKQKKGLILMIRQATEQDLPQILAIYNEAILHTTAVYAYEAKTLEDRLQWMKEKQEGGYPIFVYELDGKAVGYATYGPFRSFPAYKYTIEHSIYVDSNYRQKGIGRFLLTALIEEATVQGYKTLVAGIDADNMGSIAMHKKFGFELAGIIKHAGYKFNRWLDLAFYQLELKGPEFPTENE